MANKGTLVCTICFLPIINNQQLGIILLVLVFLLYCAMVMLHSNLQLIQVSFDLMQK